MIFNRVDLAKQNYAGSNCGLSKLLVLFLQEYDALDEEQHQLGEKLNELEDNPPR